MGTVGQVIQRRHGEILEGWTRAALARPSARDLSPAELASLMPQFLSLLGGSEGADHSLNEQQKHLIERHLANRLREGFDLNEILTEFTMLGRCVYEVIRREPASEQPAGEEIARMFAELTLTCAAVTRIYTEQLLEDGQHTARYTRLLQNLAGAAGSVHAATAPLRKRLDEVLSLIMEAMGAQTAALLLFDAKDHGLIMSASVGDADEHLEQYASSTDASSFAGKIAVTPGETTSVLDAATTELEVSDTLRQSGIHSLLGVRLAARHLLRGVIYIGIREKRSFTSSEARRIETLGEALVVHLENAQLQAALHEKIAELKAESQLRDRFVSVLMHDLRGPLTSAKVNTQLLIETVGAPAGQALARKILRSVDRLDWMVGDLLDANRIRAGQRLPLTIENCNLGSLARDVVDELSVGLGERFVLNAQQQVRGMWGAAQLRRAIWNLATNGVKYGDEGAPVTISVANSGAEAVLSVHNQGASIPPETQAELFKPFSRGSAKVRGDHPGWGLGLTLVWGCVEAHGGRISVESLPDKGTTITVTLPADARAYSD